MSELGNRIKELLNEGNMYEWNPEKIAQLLVTPPSGDLHVFEVMPSFAPNDRKKALAITSIEVNAFKRGLTGYSSLWSIPVAAIERANPFSDPFQGYLTDGVRVSAGPTEREFVFGFFNQPHLSAMAAEMATNAATLIHRSANI